jgi:hypothetical protein
MTLPNNAEIKQALRGAIWLDRKALNQHILWQMSLDVRIVEL